MTITRQFRASRILLVLGGLEGALVASLWLSRNLSRANLSDAPFGAVLALVVAALCVGLAAWAWLRFRVEHANALAERQGVSLGRHLASSVQMGVFVNAFLVMQIVAQLR